MNRSMVLAIVLSTVGLATEALAQSTALTADVKRDYKTVRDFFMRAAEKMPEGDYAFKPTPDVRSFGQQIAHVADDQYNLCAGQE
jgi:hypothetical protein